MRAQIHSASLYGFHPVSPLLRSGWTNSHLSPEVTVLMVAPSTPALLTQWTWEPSVLIGLAILVALYFYAIGPLRRRRALGPPASPRQVTCFVLSMITLVIGLLSPIDYIGDRYLFSVHMTQHLLLATL